MAESAPAGRTGDTTRVAGVGSTLTIIARPDGLVDVVSTRGSTRGSARGGRAHTAAPTAQHALFRAEDIQAWAPHAADAATWFISTRCRAEGDGSEQAGELAAVLPGTETADSAELEALRTETGNPQFELRCLFDGDRGRPQASVRAGPYNGTSVMLASAGQLAIVVRAMRRQAERASALAHLNASESPLRTVRPGSPLRGH